MLATSMPVPALGISEGLLLALGLAYVGAHLGFVLAVRRLAMVIPGSCRFCHPMRWLLIPLPVVGAVAALTGIPRMWRAVERDLAEHGLPAPSRTWLGYGVAYAVGRLLLLVPGTQLLGLTLQLAGAIGFLWHLARIADALHTPEVAIA